MIYANGRESNNNPNFTPSDNWKDDGIAEMLSSGSPMTTRIYHQYYQYDSVGNILEMKHTTLPNANGDWRRTYQYENKNNRLRSTAVGGDTFTYPHHAQHGYINDMPHLSQMDWNFKEELQATATQVINNGDTLEITYYVYDGSGQRVRKITETANGASIKNERIYIGNAFEVYRQNDGLERETLHLMDDQSRVAMLDSRTKGNDEFEQQTLRYQLGNHLGSVSLEVNHNAEVINYEEYHPYGTTAYQAKNATIKAVAKRYRYTGMERDEETGMNYHSARYYLVWLGRWLSADPIGIGDGGNLYEYVEGNPIRFIDFTGNAALEPNVKALFDIVVIAILEKGIEQGLSLEEIYTLIVQTYAEQVTGGVKNSKGKFRLFNEQARVRRNKQGEIVEILEDKEELKKRGINIIQLNQKEDTPEGRKNKVSPTFNYDFVDVSIEHHIERLKELWHIDLKNERVDRRTFFSRLYRAGYATAGKHTPNDRKDDYDTDIINNIEPGVRRRLSKWIDSEIKKVEQEIQELGADVKQVEEEIKKLMEEREKENLTDEQRQKIEEEIFIKYGQRQNLIDAIGQNIINIQNLSDLKDTANFVKRKEKSE